MTFMALAKVKVESVKEASKDGSFKEAVGIEAVSMLEGGTTVADWSDEAECRQDIITEDTTPDRGIWDEGVSNKAEHLGKAEASAQRLMGSSMAGVEAVSKRADINEATVLVEGNQLGRAEAPAQRLTGSSMAGVGAISERANINEAVGLAKADQLGKAETSAQRLMGSSMAGVEAISERADNSEEADTGLGMW